MLLSHMDLGDLYGLLHVATSHIRCTQQNSNEDGLER